MKLELPLAEMTVAEKLEAMELLWADLSKDYPDELTPEWHREILEEREKLLSEGKIKVLDFDDAMRDLRRELNENQNS